MNAKSILVALIIGISLTVWAGMAIKSYGEKQVEAMKQRRASYTN